jgi:hypothetical protein
MDSDFHFLNNVQPYFSFFFFFFLGALLLSLSAFHFKLSLLLEESVVSFYVLGIPSGPPDMGDLSCSSSFFWNHHCFTFPNHLSQNIVAVYVPSLSPSLLSLNCSASTFNFNYSFTPAGLSSSKGLNTMECGLSSK